MNPTEHYDVIVIGAGLAGLSAAYESGQRFQRVLVLEARNEPGGKIITRRKENIAYELGAIFAFHPDWVPFPVEAGQRLPEDHPIGLVLNGRVIAGDTTQACLQGLDPSLRALLLLPHFFESPAPQPAMLGADLYAALNGFLQVIHPGELTEYVPARRRDSLIRHDVAHFQDGNEAVIKAFSAHANAEVRTECLVTQLRPERENVTVHWQTRQGEACAVASWVVLATPAREARALTQGMAAASTVFLNSVRYGKGIAVILGIHNAALQSFAYIVSPQGRVNTFIFHHYSANASEMIVLTAYLVAGNAETTWNLDDHELTALVCAELDALNIGSVTAEQIAFSDVYRWPEVGAIISEKAYSGFSNACLRPSDRIVLAGDYTWWNHQQMPYGMEAAIASGQQAAAMIGVEEQTTATDFRAEPLAISLVTGLTDNGPEFKGNTADGTIAFYGLILQAEPDMALERYLVGEAEDGLWAYQQGYGVTSLDSALVIEGLLTTGRHVSLLNYSVDRLVTECFDAQTGGFHTIPLTHAKRAPYWDGADCVATAYCAWLLAQIAPERHAEVITTCAEYLKRKQLITGRWAGKWFPSETLPVWYAIRFLATMGGAYVQNCDRARLWLCSQQRRDGSWQGSIIESSAAMLALNALHGTQEAIRRGREWILNRHTAQGWPGEPILHYWFEDAGIKTYFHTRDSGRITTAWAQIALRKTKQA